MFCSAFQENSGDLSWWALSAPFPATCKVRSFAEFKQNPTSVFVLILHCCHNILQFQGLMNCLNISPCPLYIICTLESDRQLLLWPARLSWHLLNLFTSFPIAEPPADVPVFTHSAWCSSPSSVAGVRYHTACLLKSPLKNGMMLVAVLCSTVHHRPTINKWWYWKRWWLRGSAGLCSQNTHPTKSFY